MRNSKVVDLINDLKSSNFKVLANDPLPEKAEVYNLNNLHHCKTIDYKQNNCIFFLNTESSIHSISPRSKTDKTRNLVNFIVEKYDDNKFFKMKRANFINKIFSRLI